LSILKTYQGIAWCQGERKLVVEGERDCA